MKISGVCIGKLSYVENKKKTINLTQYNWQHIVF